MGYLITQIALYMLATFLLGLLLGWLIWRYGREASTVDEKALKDERDALRRNRDDLNEKIAELRVENAEAKAALEACNARCHQLEGQAATASVTVPEAAATPMVKAVLELEAAADSAAVDPGWKPEGIDGPRGGAADDLQKIKGIGPKLEKLLHSMGFYHFDQIAGWTENEVAWVDQNLEGFFGRVTRDRWIDQAQDLASR